ncbi:hypothetical protein B0I35DRAFT_425106 [Stachybotrys elegans]|uniref:Zn(2)-C6 fungal-type domain-containing protein n=1 Tax=Stachybotrys elegans TaxID=80388 RepID=A0A8K0SU59_9HYPO|nr:hypothetical protein B0I35DRAFT_425106 [Stachybotrys elegans]
MLGYLGYCRRNMQMMNESEPTARRRRRPAVSCAPCRKRKVRCNRNLPCNNCCKTNPSRCVYEDNPPLTQDANLEPNRPLVLPNLEALHAERNASSLESSSRSTAPTLVFSDNHTTSTSPDFAPSEIESMRLKIKQLEEHVAKLTTSSSANTAASLAEPAVAPQIETCETAIGGVFHFHRAGSQRGSPYLSRTVMHKTRMFGQSHWIGIVPMLGSILTASEGYLRENPDAIVGLQKCKAMARIVKAKRFELASTVVADVPAKNIADDLVENYVRTYESVYRILHMPTFQKDYEAFWVSEQHDEAFLVQLRLVLAIGASINDDRFSMRISAMSWVYAAQSYLAQPIFKSRFTIQNIQTSLLLLLARECVGIGEEFIWISAGSLLRTAIYQGFHRDPEKLAKMSPYQVEMRRRLWNTILEMNILSAHCAGGPPMLSLDDFDTLPPRNLDDEQLLTEGPVEKPQTQYTKTSVSIAMRQLLPIRLKVTKLLNDINSSGTYETILQLDKELRTTFQAIGARFKRFASTNPAESYFATKWTELVIHRYITSLHLPFFAASTSNPMYAYSRKTVIESSLQISRLAYAAGTPHSFGCEPTPTNLNDVRRCYRCTSGFTRGAIMQATLVIFLEIKSQLEDESSFVQAQPRPDLLAANDDAKAWFIDCMLAGETNVKGLLMASYYSVHVKGLLRKATEDELPQGLVQAVKEANERGFEILESMIAENEGISAMDQLDHMSFDTMSDLPDFFNMPDVIFGSMDTDTMNWGV